MLKHKIKAGAGQSKELRKADQQNQQAELGVTCSTVQQVDYRGK